VKEKGSGSGLVKEKETRNIIKKERKPNLFKIEELVQKKKNKIKTGETEGHFPRATLTAPCEGEKKKGKEAAKCKDPVLKPGKGIPLRGGKSPF